MEIRDIKEQLNELVALLQQSEAQRKELIKEQKMREQAVAIALATPPSVRYLPNSSQFIIYIAKSSHVSWLKILVSFFAIDDI